MLGAVGENPMEEVKLAFDAGGAYVVSTGRSDHRRKFWKVAFGPGTAAPLRIIIPINTPY